MSPLAALLDHALSPWLLAATLACEWWATWFTLWRNFSTTLFFTLAANGASLGFGWILLRSGALGSLEPTPAGAAAAPPLAWLLAWLCLVGLCVLVESTVLRTLMRRRHRSWSWDRYDLMLYVAANVFTLGLAAGHLALDL